MNICYLASRSEKELFVIVPKTIVEKLLKGSAKRSVRPWGAEKVKDIPGVDFYMGTTEEVIVDGITVTFTKRDRYLFWITEEAAREFLPRELLLKLS